MSKEQITFLLYSKIVEIIIDSNLNIQSIPDDVEIQMYSEIYNSLEELYEDSLYGCLYGRWSSSCRDVCIRLWDTLNDTARSIGGWVIEKCKWTPPPTSSPRSAPSFQLN